MAFVLASNGFVPSNPQLRAFHPLAPHRKRRSRKKKIRCSRNIYPVAPDSIFRNDYAVKINS